MRQKFRKISWSGEKELETSGKLAWVSAAMLVLLVSAWGCRMYEELPKTTQIWIEDVRTGVRGSAVSIHTQVTVDAVDVRRFSLQEVNNIVSMWIGKRDLYLEPSTRVRTKDWIDSRIAYLQASRTDDSLIEAETGSFCGNAYMSGLVLSLEVRKVRYLQTLDQKIMDLRRERSSAPFNYYSTKTQPKMRNGGFEVKGITRLGHNAEASVWIESGKIRLERYPYSRNAHYKGEAYSKVPLTIRKKEALACAQDFLEQMDIHHVTLVESRREDYCFRFTFDAYWTALNQRSFVQVGPDARGDRIEIQVDDKGVSLFSWTQATQPCADMGDAEMLMKFSSIQKRVKSELQQICRADKASRIHVNRMHLCMQEGKIPVWEIRGDVTIPNGDGNEQVHSDQVILILNAITGEIVP